MQFCLISGGEVVPILERVSTLKEYPIYHDLSAIQLDVENANPSFPYPVSVQLSHNPWPCSYALASLYCFISCYSL